MEQLLEVTGSLAAATTEDAVARAITSGGIQALGAAYGGIWLLDREKQALRLVAFSTLPRGSAEHWTMVPLDLDAPLPDAVRTKRAIFVDSFADYRARYPISYQRIQNTMPSADGSYAMIPIADGGPAIGALAITYDRPHAIGASDRTFVQIIARQCALALERIFPTAEAWAS